MDNTRNEISHLIQAGIIPADKVDAALKVAGVHPSPSDWKSFVGKLLLWLGALALSNALIFFIAYNWDDMGRFAKFGLVEVLLVLSVAFAWKTSPGKASLSSADHQRRSLLSRVALLVASLLLGVLLAFYGQTYQTGADTWQLFFTWAVLMLPWTFSARFPAIWILWLGLINLSAVLYFQTFRGIFSVIFTSDTGVLWVLTLINGGAFLLWEWLQTRWHWLSESWATRLLAFASGAPLTSLVIDSIFDRGVNVLPTFLWLITMSLIYVVYRKYKPDLFMLAMACLSGITVILGFAGKFLFDMIDAELFAFLMMAILVIGLGGGAAIWLKRIHQEQLKIPTNGAEA